MMNVLEEKKLSMKTDELKEEVWKIWNEVHRDIDQLRELAFKMQGTVYSDIFLKRHYGKHESKTQDSIDPIFTTQPNPNGCVQYAQDAELVAMTYQKSTEGRKIATPLQILEITSRAGHLLALTERLMACFEDVSKAQARPNKEFEMFRIVSSAMTIVATARDHLGSASGHIKNVQTKIGHYEYARLLIGWLAPAVVIYLCFHPILPVPNPLPAQYRVEWEVFHWSWFGAVSISLVTISEDVLKGNFDPRKIGKYRYKIPVAPFVGAILILFFSIFGIVMNSDGQEVKSLTISTSDHMSLPAIIIISFLFGFFGKRSLDLLDEAWRRIFPQTQKDVES